MSLDPVSVRVAGCGLVFFLPGACQAHLEYLATLSTFFRCFTSRSLSCGSEMMVSALCVSVLMTLILCSIFSQHHSTSVSVFLSVGVLPRPSSMFSLLHRLQYCSPRVLTISVSLLLCSYLCLPHQLLCSYLLIPDVLNPP